jgi:ferredoxin
MEAAYEFDLVVIGSGPAGQSAAIQAAKLGKRVALIERKRGVGGVTVHLGTLPSKTFREAVISLKRGTVQRSLEAAGIDAGSLCRGGACGVCAVPVRAGELEHRDHYLSAQERQSGGLVMPCVSRARGDSLVLDI